jgi:hypothetical protein
MILEGGIAQEGPQRPWQQLGMFLREDLAGSVSMDSIAGLQEVVEFRILLKVKRT